MTNRNPTPEFRRTALVPSVLAAIVLLIGVAFVGADAYLVIQFVVSILALIVAVIAWQARKWWFVPPLVAVAVLFNPVVVIPLPELTLLIVHYASILVFLIVGGLVKARNEEDRNRR